MPDKCAFLFLTVENLHNQALWAAFFKGANLNSNGNCSIYIHNKFPIRGQFSYYSIPNRTATAWGKISLVKATLLLLKESFKDTNNKFFMLLSESCIPLYSFVEIYRKIFDYNSTVMSGYITVDCSKRYKSLLHKNFFTKANFKKQSQWILFKRDTVEFLIKNDFTHIFGKDAIVPDEHYFVNVCEKYNLPYINRNLTFVNWVESDTPGHPKIYTTVSEDYKKLIRSKGFLFIRKVMPITLPTSRRVSCVIKMKR